MRRGALYPAYLYDQVGAGEISDWSFEEDDDNAPHAPLPIRWNRGWYGLLSLQQRMVQVDENEVNAGLWRAYRLSEPRPYFLECNMNTPPSHPAGHTCRTVRARQPRRNSSFRYALHPACSSQGTLS